ncbi:adenosylcobinamide-GDP ribazoletransferase [Kallotenue papyrolyticum]|uniref:adenosylcobinamide-GDP ribazoletransferase n=1 Tax=Kallotenue papyrolyticum TaxID=1325125 RepID=UPI0004BAA710|nr:adenosylcobinamide-GDP ribazoletransferase [Kallotenue papyrolyticum]
MTARHRGLPRMSWWPLQALGEALRFLTVLPVPGLPPLSERNLVRAMAAFPLAGVVIGGGGLLAGWLAGWLWGPALQPLSVVIAWMVLTLGLHLDGLADSCDALLSWRSRERKLEIMKDSRIGTMGALALLAIVLLKIGALTTLGEQWWRGALLAPMWGRWADIYGIFYFPAAREGGLGHTFHAQVRRRDFAIATLSALLLGAALLPPWGALLLLALWPVIDVLARRMVAALGGLTGDTYGALAEIGETVTLLTLAALYRHGWW